MTQRALIIGALARESGRISGALACDDSRHLSAILRALGAGVAWQDDRVEVRPARLQSKGQRLFCGNAGTAIRFASCLALVCDGSLLLDGDERMRQRPIGPLGEALQRLNVTVAYPERTGFPPLHLQRQADPPRIATVDTSRSSQFASGLLLVAPLLPGGLEVRLQGQAVSRPYLIMTTGMMTRAGARVRWLADDRIRVEAGVYAPGEQVVEPDWSTAAFVLTASRITGLPVDVPELPPAAESLQGDALFADMLIDLERPGPHRFDLSQVPDLIAPLVAAALFADSPTRILGAAHTRIKESDRIAVLARGLRQLGARVTEHEDGLELEPLTGPVDREVRIDPAGDHRMAMAFGLLSLKWPGIRVLQPDCVSKSYPAFWDMLDRFRNELGPGGRS